MNEFTQHIPAFVDVGREPPPSFEFDTLDELLSNEVVKRYGKGKDFSHFALSDNYLMEISDSGFHWWVVGYIKNPDDIDLPKWEGWKYRAELSNGKKVILNGDEVVSSCGGELTLRDGTKARNLR